MQFAHEKLMVYHKVLVHIGAEAKTMLVRIGRITAAQDYDE